MGYELTARENRWRVAVAEDDDAFRRLVTNALRLDGFEVVEAKNGIELVERLRNPGRPGGSKAGFDLVVSDIRMPHVNGLDVLAMLRSEDWAIPMILMTGFGDSEVHEDALRLGADAVFDKPFDLVDLRTMALHLSGRL